MKLLPANNRIINSKRCQDEYRQKDIEELIRLLNSKETFTFLKSKNGLFPASDTKEKELGYGDIWVRDNVHIAFAHWFCGDLDTAVTCANALYEHFERQRDRFLNIISGNTSPEQVTKRPHIRFKADGSELIKSWPHAQNDALGYFLWLYCSLSLEKKINLGEKEFSLLATFGQYFKTIEYWQDEDSGHWEEARKISASSIGCILAGLRVLRRLYIDQNIRSLKICSDSQVFAIEDIDDLMFRGSETLKKILPWECRQKNPRKERRLDAALLFLIYPLKEIDGPLGRQIVDDVVDSLLGDFGIKRYDGDSYWCGNYDDFLKGKEGTDDFSNRIKDRDKLLNPGEEAQWCIFDPILSVIYGHWYLEYGESKDLKRQIWHLNRSLGQITGDSEEHASFQCPELYYLKDGKRRPGPTLPLLWTQANLWQALHTMMKVCETFQSP